MAHFFLTWNDRFGDIKRDFSHWLVLDWFFFFYIDGLNVHEWYMKILCSNFSLKKQNFTHTLNAIWWENIYVDIYNIKKKNTYSTYELSRQHNYTLQYNFRWKAFPDFYVYVFFVFGSYGTKQFTAMTTTLSYSH